MVFLRFNIKKQDHNAIILLSGGLDSATVLGLAKAEGYACHTMAFRYGQRHSVELRAAEAVASSLGSLRHIVVDIDLRKWGGSALTDDIDVPLDQPIDPSVIPVTYVPARNLIFLSFALGWAEVLPASRIFIGVNAMDYSGYPDCRPEFVSAFQRIIDVGTRAGVEGVGPLVVAPLLNMKKSEIIRCGTGLGVDYGLTVSCYNADEAGRACGSCDSCRLRRQGFAEAGVQDPTRYR